MGFSLERGNLYQNDNIEVAKETFKEKRDSVLDSIINGGKSTQDSTKREDYRTMLKEKIKEGFIDREYLERHAWDKERILITSDIVDFLLPQISEAREVSMEKGESFQPIIKQIDETILITENGKGPENGSEEGVEERLIPRFELLVKFLRENGIKDSKYFCYKGKNKTEMMRAESYVMFVVPDLGKMVFLCNEEGNATYIIHNAPNKSEFEKLLRDEEIEKSERQPQFYYHMSKYDLLDLEKEFGIVSRVRWDEKDWLELMGGELTKDFNSGVSAEDMGNFLKKQKEEKNIKAEKVVDGWMANRTLADRLGVDSGTVKSIADKYLQENKGWKQQRRNKNEKLYWYYAPELVEIITKEIKSREETTDGWMTNGALADRLGVDFSTVKSIANKYLQKNENWKNQRKAKRGMFWYYAPELVEIITKEVLEDRKKASDGWLTKTALAREFNKDPSFVKSIADKYLQKNKDWKQQRISKRGTLCWHYSPELVAIIRQTMESGKQKEATST